MRLHQNYDTNNTLSNTTNFVLKCSPHFSRIGTIPLILLRNGKILLDVLKSHVVEICLKIPCTLHSNKFRTHRHFQGILRKLYFKGITYVNVDVYRHEKLHKGDEIHPYKSQYAI